MKSVIRPFPPFPTLMGLVGVTLCALLIAGCEPDTVAGGSVGTGNPTEITLSFTQNDVPVAVTGNLRVYSGRHIPISGFDSLPLAEFPLSNAYDFKLEAALLAQALTTSSKAKDSVFPDSVWEPVSLTVSGESLGGIDFRFAYHVKTGVFSERGPDGGAFGGKGFSGKVRIPLSEYVDYSGNLTFPPELMLDSVNYLRHTLFIRGTNHRAEATAGRFTFSRLPRGRYEILMVSLHSERPITNPPAPVPLFSLDRILDTDTSATYMRRNVAETVTP